MTSKLHGTGLGLARVRAVVERHGGRIEADNRIGGGARFVFHFPSPRRKVMASSILIVDDEARLAEVLAVGLEGRGFEAAFACSADAALGHVATQRVDLVLTDLRMPGLSGQELLRRLRASTPACRS